MHVELRGGKISNVLEQNAFVIRTWSDSSGLFPWKGGSRVEGLCFRNAGRTDPRDDFDALGGLIELLVAGSEQLHAAFEAGQRLIE
jgi:hypothetical protein